jgi:hypothetical protein
LFGGPGSIEQLAKKLRHNAWYELLYRQWSKTMHADGLVRAKLYKRDIRVLRDNSELTNTAVFTIHFGIRATELVLRFYRSEELVRFCEWCRDEILIHMPEAGSAH